MSGAEPDVLGMIAFARTQMRGAVLASRDDARDRAAARQAIGHAREALAMVEGLARGMRPEPPRQTRAEPVPEDSATILDAFAAAFRGARKPTWVEQQAEQIRRRQEQRKARRDRVP